MGLWRNGSASDSRSDGWAFESLWPHFFMFAFANGDFLLVRSFYCHCDTAFRDSIVVSISACHADDPGSIPGRGVFVRRRIGKSFFRMVCRTSGTVREGPVAQWIRHRSTEPEIVGSSPTRVSFSFSCLNGS